VGKRLESNPERYNGVYLLKKPFELIDLLEKVEEMLELAGR